MIVEKALSKFTISNIRLNHRKPWWELDTFSNSEYQMLWDIPRRIVEESSSRFVFGIRLGTGKHAFFVLINLKKNSPTIANYWICDNRQNVRWLSFWHKTFSVLLGLTNSKTVSTNPMLVTMKKTPASFNLFVLFWHWYRFLH